MESGIKFTGMFAETVAGWITSKSKLGSVHERSIVNMSHKPAAAMSGLSLLGGMFAYTRYSSVPSLVASCGIGGAFALSSMRIRDGLDYGYEGAAASSLALLFPTMRRAIVTRAPVPSIMTILALASSGYYAKEVYERRM